MLSRRKFIKQTAVGTSGLLGAFYIDDISALAPERSGNALYKISRQLTESWGKTLLDLQVRDRKDINYGTIIYPPENAVHGRMGDTIYPFLHLAKTTNNHAYLDAAILLYRWMEKTVSQDDGSWLNEPEAGSWKGTTVFTTIALAEAIKQHGSILENEFKNEITGRLKKSGDFIYNNFSLDYGNINYPVAASYGLSLLGEILDEPPFSKRGRELAHQSLSFITPKDGFLSGEGKPNYVTSGKQCYSVDLGYNVEESLPSLVLYGLLTKDEEVLDAVTRSMEVHMEFMLPDGGWDNSWGTRNYKWTYWGSRTSDGCQPAYALMVQRNPAFYKVALKNAELLKACTKNGILYGGPHYISHQVPASLHHTFCHIKALASILDHGIPDPKANMEKLMLPREKIYGSKFFSDIQTGLISKGRFRATVTGYDRNYNNYKAGHASGGALTMLWHETAGVIMTASMNEYQLYEAQNMQVDHDPLSMPLTPRIELKEGGITYMNIHDFGAVISIENDHDVIKVHTTSKLVDKDQQHPSSGEINCKVSYVFTDNKVTLHFKHDAHHERHVKIIVPVISPSTEKVVIIPGKKVDIFRNNAVLHLSADKNMKLLLSEGRVFNFVPGLEALPFCMEENEIQIEVAVEALNKKQ